MFVRLTFDLVFPCDGIVVFYNVSNLMYLLFLNSFLTCFLSAICSQTTSDGHFSLVNKMLEKMLAGKIKISKIFSAVSSLHSEQLSSGSSSRPWEVSGFKGVHSCFVEFDLFLHMCMKETSLR